MPGPPVALVDIHLLAGPGSGRSTFIRRYTMQRYDPVCNVLCHEDCVTRVRTVAGTSVAVRLDNENPTYYCDLPDEDVHCYPTVDKPDAVLTVINPAYPPSIEGGIKARLDRFHKVVRVGAEDVVDGVVMVKDIGMSWRGVQEQESLNLTPEEMEVKEREWQEGAEKGYELARRLGVRATVVCSRTGEGVQEAVEDLVVRVLEKRKADEARKAEEGRRQEEARMLAAMPCWKRPLWRLKARRERRKGV